jgi:hypothetical protein
MLRNQALESKPASLAETVWSDLTLLKGAQEDSLQPAGEQPRKIGLAHRQRKSAQIVAAYCEHVEGAGLDFLVVLAGMQRLEIGDAINAQDSGLAVDHKLADAVFQGGFDYPRITIRPVTAAARDQPDAIQGAG